MRGPTKYYFFAFLSLSVVAFFSLLLSPIHQLGHLQGFEAVFISDGTTQLKVVSDEAIVYIEHLDEWHPLGSIQKGEHVYYTEQFENRYEIL